MALFEDALPEIIILSADKYAEGDVSGCSVYYTFNSDLTPQMNTGTSFGEVPAKVWAPKELFEKIPVAPAKYQATFRMRVKKNTPTLVLEDVHFISRIKVVEEHMSAAPPAEVAAAAAESAKSGK